jgi:hypothetical protein
MKPLKMVYSKELKAIIWNYHTTEGLGALKILKKLKNTEYVVSLSGINQLLQRRKVRFVRMRDSCYYRST